MMPEPMDTPSHFLCLTGAPAQNREYPLDRGDTVLHAPSGTFVHDHGVAGLSMTLERITGVAIADWSEVAEHRVEQDGEGLKHHVRFHAGGFVEVRCDPQGEIIHIDSACTTSHADFHTGLVTFGAYRVENELPPNAPPPTPA